MKRRDDLPRYMELRRRTQKRRAFAMWAGACALIVVCLLAFVYAQQQRRRGGVTAAGGANAANVGGAAQTINVKANGDFQAALDRARPGDTILLEAGATFRGTFNLPKKTGANEFITIRTSASDAQLPPPGERLDPVRYAAVLPKIVSNAANTSAVTATNGAHHYRFLGVEFWATPGGGGNIISIGTSEEKTLADLPHHFEFDRIYAHGSPTEGQRRGIALNGRDVRIVNSHFSDFKRKGDESQAIAGWNGTGNYEITNNYIEAAAEGVLFGGADSKLNVVASDIIVRGNHFNKPVAWRDQGWVVKNHFEIKSARRVVVDSNLLTNNWAHAQDGFAVLFTVRDEDGADPQATIEDVLFVNNVVRGMGGGVNLLGDEGRGGHRVTIRNNVFDDLDPAKWGGRGYFMKLTAWDGLVVENNTLITKGAGIALPYGEPTTGFVMRNNVVTPTEYGFYGDGGLTGQRALDKFFPGSIVTHNAFIGGIAGDLRGRNMYPDTLLQLKFVNPQAGDYRLRPDSPLRGKGANGADIGAKPDAPVTASFGGR